MTRSLLRPLRTRRVAPRSSHSRSNSAAKSLTVTPATRKTVAAIGALWVSFAVTASADPVPTILPPADAAARVLDPNQSGDHTRMGKPERPADYATRETENGQTFGILGSRPAPAGKSMPWSPGTGPSVAPSSTGARGIVFLPTKINPDAAPPRPVRPERRPDATGASAMIAYLKSISK
jgi:hypothetical protein